MKKEILNGKKTINYFILKNVPNIKNTDLIKI
jgi:hypothetical protein